MESTGAICAELRFIGIQTIFCLPIHGRDAAQGAFTGGIVQARYRNVEGKPQRFNGLLQIISGKSADICDFVICQLHKYFCITQELRHIVCIFTHSRIKAVVMIQQQIIRNLISN